MRTTILLLLGFVCLSAQGQPVAPTVPTLNTNRPTLFGGRSSRSLSLDECLKLALEHNLRIQVVRSDPAISRYQLAASYGLYDPVFSVQYLKFNNTTEGRFNPNTGTTSDPAESESDTVSPTLSGVLPTGLTYELGGNFTYSRGTRDNTSDFENYVTDVNIALEQPLLRNFWTDAARTEIQILKRDYQISELTLDFEVRSVIRDVQIAYYAYIFALEDVKVQDKALELANTLVSENNEKVKQGVMAPLDARQAESQAATALADYIQAQGRAVIAENLLKNQITDDFQGWQRTLIEPTEKLVAVPERLSVVESWATALAQRPDLKQLELQAEIAKLNLKLRKNQLFPQLNLFGSYGRNGLDNSLPQSVVFDTNNFIFVTNAAQSAKLGNAFEDITQNRNPKYTYGAVFSMPLSRKLERNRYAVAKEQDKQIDATIRQLSQQIQHDVDTAIVAAQTSYERVGATRQARMFAELALDAEQKKLQAGTTTQFEVLRLQRDLTTARLEEIRALTAYNQALIEVFFRDGTILDRNKIRLKFR